MRFLGLVDEAYIEGTTFKMKCSYCTYDALRFFFDLFDQYAELEGKYGDSSAFVCMRSKVGAHLQKRTPQELYGLVRAAQYLKCNVMMHFLTQKAGLIHKAAEMGRLMFYRHSSMLNAM